MILPFSFRWDADLVTRGDTAAGTAGEGELIFFFNIGVSCAARSTISTMNKDLRVSYKHPLGKNLLQLQSKLLNSGFLPYNVFHVI